MILCICHHKGCADGFGAAAAVAYHNRRGPRHPEVIFRLGYGKNTERVGRMVAGLLSMAGEKEFTVAFVDITPSPALAKALAESIERSGGFPRRMVIMDHHYEIDDSRFLDLGWEDVRVLCDRSRSGARIAWEETPRLVFDEEAKPGHLPDMIRLIEDRDLWRFKFGDETKSFGFGIKAILSRKYGYESWIEFIDDPSPVKEIGEPIYGWWRETASLAFSSFPASLWAVFDQSLFSLAEASGFRVLLIDMSGDGKPFLFSPPYPDILLGSEVASLFLDEVPVPQYTVVAIRKEGSIGFRSRNGDARRIAERFGGGGHPNASGTTLVKEFLKETTCLKTGKEIWS